MDARLGGGGGARLGDLAWVALVFAVSAAASAVAFRPDYAGTATFPGIILGARAVLAAIALARAHRDGDLSAWIKPKWGDFSGGALTAALLFAAAYALGRGLAAEGTPRHAWMFRLYLQLGSPEVLLGTFYE